MFKVHAVAEGNPGIGDHLRSFDSYPAAKRYAERRALGYYMGTVIIDDRRGIADFGNAFTMAADCEKEVVAPFYAKRYRG